MITDKVLFQRAANGAAYLDSTDLGWWRQIDVRDLDLMSCHSCILGQLCGSYYEAATLRFGRFNAPRALDLGFWAGYVEEIGGCKELERRFKVLAAAWVEEINRRKAMAAVQTSPAKGSGVTCEA